MEALCRVMSDSVGGDLSAIWEIEREACGAVKKDEILVFGHTHKPFVNKKENVANTGSWVTESRIHNTYVEFHPGEISLKVFRGGGITDRIEC